MEEIDVFKKDMDEQRQNSVKPIYNLMKSQVFTKRYKRDVIDAIIENTSEFLEELKVMRDSI